MTYKETIRYILEAMPMFQRIGAAAYKGDLVNANVLDKYFNFPHKKFKTIHIAGTNGKGSVSHMIASVCQAAGYKTGLFTSPHLVDFRERIRINGKEIPEEYVVKFIQLHRPKFDEINPSFFEMSVFMAFEYFSQECVDIAIIETGLGGRLDTTNIITPVLSVITNISKDHTQILGNSLEQIAREKAGIIKKKIPVVIGESQDETKSVFKEYAENAESEIFFADEIFQVDYQLRQSNGLSSYYFKNSPWQNLNPLQSDLNGIYQKKNICTTMMALVVLKNYGIVVSDKDINGGICNIVKLTGIKGRWQEISYNPLIVCDTGHNEAGIKAVLEQIENTPYRNLHMVLGFVADKDLNAIIQILPRNAKYYLCQPDVPRAKNVADLYKEFNSINLNSTPYTKVKDAFYIALAKAEKDDLIFIGGSNFVVADFLR